MYSKYYSTYNSINKLYFIHHKLRFNYSYFQGLMVIVIVFITYIS